MQHIPPILNKMSFVYTPWTRCSQRYTPDVGKRQTGVIFPRETNQSVINAAAPTIKSGKSYVYATDSEIEYSNDDNKTVVNETETDFQNELAHQTPPSAPP